jgi:hypothetical protein
MIHDPPKRASLLCTCLCLVLVTFTGDTVQAQTRSETGRHKPEPPAKSEEEASPTDRESAGAEERRWHLGLLGGVQGGSDLFRVEVVDGPPVPWDPDTGGGFQSGRFTATLDRNFGLGLFVARDLSRIWSARFDLVYSRMDVAAEALVGQTGAVFLFDRMYVLNLGLGVEARLARARSYPFLLAALLVSNLDPVRAEGLGQTNLGARVGLGYFHSFQRIWGLRLEARLARTGFSVGDYVPRSSNPDQPVIDYDVQDHVTFFEFLIGIQAKL